MSPSKIFSAALVAGAMFGATAASAAVLATLNPQADNGLGAAGVIGTNAAFQAVGFQSNLASTLTINANSGFTSYVETGTITITSFQDASNSTVASGVGIPGGYQLIGDFTLTGWGQWGPNPFGPGALFAAATGSNSLTLNLRAISQPSLGSQTINLGVATLNNASPAFAFATAFGSVANGSVGSAQTTLTAGLNFTPAAGTVGANGFFQAPNPFYINLAVGNAGGNTSNTGYSVSPSGVVTFTTPLPGTNLGTANVTFVAPVPEPGALALVGVALAGVGLFTRRKAVKA
jgi:hypothetical protein